MAKILILYYSSWGHVETLAQFVKKGAEPISERVDIRRVPELVTQDVATEANYKLDQPAPLASIDELPRYNAIIFGTPTRFGNMASQMRNFLDQTGKLWANGALIGKVGSVFVSTGTGGGNETTITSFHTTLLHHGMIIAGLPYSDPELTDLTEVKGGGPLGAGTLAGTDGKRQPSEIECRLAAAQGKHVATIADHLLKGRQ